MPAVQSPNPLLEEFAELIASGGTPAESHLRFGQVLAEPLGLRMGSICWNKRKLGNRALSS